jgi:hypothetical protein
VEDKSSHHVRDATEEASDVHFFMQEKDLQLRQKGTRGVAISRAVLSVVVHK